MRKETDACVFFLAKDIIHNNCLVSLDCFFSRDSCIAVKWFG